MNELDRFRCALLGLACGDAVGTTMEIKKRCIFTPLTDMVLRIRALDMKME